MTQSSYQCLWCGAETVAADHPAEIGSVRPPTPSAEPPEDHLLEHPAGDTLPPPSAPPSPPEPTTPTRTDSTTPPSPATPRLPCTRCGEDRIPANAIQCPTCYWTLDETWDEHEAYNWHVGNDLRCRDCGALWSSKVQYCLGDWCGGPVEPVDGSWHVAWRLLNSANPGQLHTTIPNFAGGRSTRGRTWRWYASGDRAQCPAPAPAPLAARARTRGSHQTA